MGYSNLIQPFNIFGSNSDTATKTSTPPSLAPASAPTSTPAPSRAALPGELAFSFDENNKMTPIPNVNNVPPAPKTPIATPQPSPTYSFLDGSKYSASGKQISAPTVVTAKQATTDLTNKELALNQVQQAQATQTQNIANQQATAQATPPATAPAATADDLNKIINGQGANPANQALQDVQDSADATFASFTQQISQIMNGTFPLTPAQQSQIQATQNSFNELKNAQEIANKNLVGQIRLSGATSGRSMTAPTINTSLVHAAVSAGIQKISALDSQASKAIADLQQGFMDKDYEMINNAYTAASSLFAQKSNTIQEMNTNVRNATNDALALHKQQMDEEQQKLDNQRVAIDFAVKNGINKPFYLVGNTAIDSKTGLPVDLATYQRMTGQQVGLPEDQTDFSQIQHIADPAVLKLQNDYPDAGILPTDSVSEATDKLGNSRIYHKETYIAPTGGDGGYSAAQINSTINQIAGAFDNEAVVKNFNVLNEAHEFVSSISNDTKNPVDDQGLIYALAKALDPSSAVREGEYATAQKYAQSLTQSYGKSVTQALNGTGFLSTDARKNIKATIESRYTASKKNYENVYNQYQKRIVDAQNGQGNSLTDYSQAFGSDLSSQLNPGEILVKDKATGQIGAIPQSEFDPNKYEQQ